MDKKLVMIAILDGWGINEKMMAMQLRLLKHLILML